MGIGFRIREAREALGYRQHELAKLIGVTASAVTNYEQDYSFPKEEILYRLIDTLAGGCQLSVSGLSPAPCLRVGSVY